MQDMSSHLKTKSQLRKVLRGMLTLQDVQYFAFTRGQDPGNIQMISKTMDRFTEPRVSVILFV